MKYIKKDQEPASLQDWKCQANEEWQPTWETLQNPQKKELHQALIQEQGAICCYCGDRIDPSSSHIEHLKPRSCYPDLELDYYNLMASCLKALEPKQPIHCGHSKEEWFKESEFVSPLDPDCENAFTFTENGRILPCPQTSTTTAAQTTIDRLSLDIPKLRLQREGAIRGITDDLDDIRPDEIPTLIETFQTRDPQGQYEPFCMAIVDVLRQFMP